MLKKYIPFLVKDENENIVSTLDIVLSYIGEKNILKKFEQAKQFNKNNKTTNKDKHEDKQEQEEEQDDQDKEKAVKWIKKLSASKDFDEQFLRELGNTTITSWTAEWILVGLD